MINQTLLKPKPINLKQTFLELNLTDLKIIQTKLRYSNRTRQTYNYNYSIPIPLKFINTDSRIKNVHR